MEKGRKWVLALTLVVAFGIVTAVTKPGATRGLRAEVAITREDIGIPGITKAYSATLTNRGRLPVRVARCNFITDAMAPGTEVAYAVQRWNESSKQWDTIVQFGKSEFCKPYPLGIVKAKLANGWLWPGRGLSSESLPVSERPRGNQLLAAATAAPHNSPQVPAPRAFST